MKNTGIYTNKTADIHNHDKHTRYHILDYIQAVFHSQMTVYEHGKLYFTNKSAGTRTI